MSTFERWISLCNRANATTVIEESYHALIARYAEPPRAYHNIDHVTHCLAEFDLLARVAKQPEIVEFAIWFHDAIYDTHRTDNEALSADFAFKTLTDMGIPFTPTANVADLIYLTRHLKMPVIMDGKIMVDVDLAILGAAPQHYDDYEMRIRQEYAWVDDKQFWGKRRDFLVTLLRRPYIFNTKQFHKRYEENARQNLQRSIARAEAELTKL